MKFTRSVITTFAALLVASSVASAQSQGPAMGGMGTGTGTGPGTGTGTGTGTGSPSTPTPTDLDLPMEKPIYVAPTPTPTPPETPIEDDGDEDDPRDEPPPVIYGEEIDSENDTLFYVIDISGSMVIDTQSYTGLDGQMMQGNRMERAKAELMRSISGLSPNFSFNIIAFDCGTRQWSQGMQQADDGNKASALAWTRSLQPTGATGTGPACALALNDKENMSVVLLTDGGPNCGASGFEGHRMMISNANTQGATVTVFGIAAAGSLRTFCQNVAADGGGSYFDVP
jgi:hypothetical protein